MSLAKFSVNQVVLVNLLFIVLLVVGGIVYATLPVDVYPNVNLDMAFIDAFWWGASADEIERLITKRIEDEIKDVAGILRLESKSHPDIGRIVVKWNEELTPQEMEAAFQNLRERLDRVTDLPKEVDGPYLTRVTLDEQFPMVQVVVADASGHGERVFRQIAREIKDDLADLDGVAKVLNITEREREIHVLLDKPKLEQYGLTVAEVGAILSSSNRNVPGGTLTLGPDELSIRAIGDVDRAEQLADIIIRKSPTGAHVRLGDIAEIKHDFERQLFTTLFQSHHCYILNVAKQRQADSLDVRNRVAQRLEEWRQRVPKGIKLELTGDSTNMIRDRIGILEKNLVFGSVLVFCVLWLFIGARNSILAIIGIPFSFLCAFIFMYLIDVSINMVSVFSLVLVSGLIVDDAIVVLENIYRHVEQGKPIRQAIIDGTDQVMWPVVSSAATTVAAFLPLLIMTGILGKFFSIIPKTVTVTLLASLFECLIILPAHYLHWGPRAPHRDPSAEQDSQTLESPPRASKWAWLREIRTSALSAYDRMLAAVLRQRYLLLIGVVSVSVVLIQARKLLIVELFPQDFPLFIADIVTRPTSSLEETQRVVETLTPVFDRFVPDTIRRYHLSIGIQIDDSGRATRLPNYAQVWMELTQTEEAQRAPEAIVRRVDKAIRDHLAKTDNRDVQSVHMWPAQSGPPLGKPVAIRIDYHDLAVSRQVADEIEAFLATIPGVTAINDDLQLGHKQVRFTLKEDVASELGLTFLDVATAIRAANDGLIVSTFKDPAYDEDVHVRVRYQEQYRQSVDDLGDVDVKTPTGAMVKLRDVADVSMGQGYALYRHHNGKRAVLVSADVDTEITDSSRVNNAVLAKFKSVEDRYEGLRLVAGGEFEETHRSFESLRWAGVIGLMLMFLILASQFRSYLQPFVVMTAVLFASIGMMLGLIVNGYPFTIVTGIALIGLFGIAVNDSLVLIDFVNQRRARGLPATEALRQSCHIRARPIVLTTLTTLAGLLPMALGAGGYSKVWSPFAMSICWGLTFSTAMTLILVPALYLIADDFKRRFAPASRNDDQAELPAAVEDPS
ncbi:MAG: efflux RND transporter permease subunit [Phycisphaerae bacterium]|nr:efflux RND transporter permease subunit [Phycisphaerae bacterium]